MMENSPKALPHEQARQSHRPNFGRDQMPLVEPIRDVEGIWGHCPACGQRAHLVSAICAQCEEPLVVAIDRRGQFILRTKNDARRARIRQLEDQLSIYWILLGSFQAIAIFSLGPMATRHLSRTASAVMQQNWMDLYFASVMVSLFVTGLMLFLCGVLVRLGYRQIAWLGVLASLVAFVITLVSPLAPVALVFGMILVPGCRLMWLWNKSPGVDHSDSALGSGRWSSF